MNNNLKPLGSTLEEFLISPNQLPAAEQKLLDACRNGTIAVMSATRPGLATPDNTIRAEFVRFLALQTDPAAPVHARGIQLFGAYISGCLDLQDCTIAVPLALERSQFEQTLHLNDATLHGLNLGGSAIPGLNGRGMNCLHSLLLNNQFSTKGELRLLGVKICGDLDCNGATLENPGGNVLSADRAEISGGIFLRGPFFANGEIRLSGAKIGGDLDFSGAKLKNSDDNTLSGDDAETNGHTLTADGAEINGSIFLMDNFSSKGEIRLTGTKIGGDLACDGATLENPGGDALCADRAKINGNVSLSNKFSAKGEIRLLGAKIGGNLSCKGATLSNARDYALSADGAEITGSVLLSSEFSAVGQIRLTGAKISGNLVCTDATLENTKDAALSAERMQVKGVFHFAKVSNKSLGIILTNCEVNTLADDPKSWSEGVALIDGFTYQRLAGSAPVDAQSRIAWLKKQQDDDLKLNFKPQPWVQLTSVLRKEGHTTAASEIAIEAQKQRQRAGQLGNRWHLRYLMHEAYGGLSGFGYRPLRTVKWMLCVWLGFALIYWQTAEFGAFAPSNPLVFHHHNYEHCRPDYVPTQTDKDKKLVTNNWIKCEAVRGEYTTFSPLFYSLDVILPLVDLQQEKDWGQYIDKPFINWPLNFSKPFNDQFLNHITRFVMWFEILFGWVCSLLLVAVLSGLAKTDKD